MTRETFVVLCDNLRVHIEKKVLVFREPISVEQRVAITLWKLATNIEFRTLAALFSVGQSTVGKIVIETIAMTTTHLPRFVQIPKGERLNKIIDDFESERGFPQPVGAIDGTHSNYSPRRKFYRLLHSKKLLLSYYASRCSLLWLVHGCLHQMARQST